MFYEEWELRLITNNSIRGVLHVGAHLAEEAPVYEKLLSGSDYGVIWVESQIDKCAQISEILDPNRHEVINATVWSESGLELDFFETNNSESSSLLELAVHQDLYPDIHVSNSYKVVTTRLDSLVAGHRFNFVNLDLQGVELEALKGLGGLITGIDWLYVEVNNKELYVNCCKVSEIDAYLRGFGFKRVSTRWVWKSGWGDAIYASNRVLTKRVSIYGKFLSYLWALITINRVARNRLPKPIRSFYRSLTRFNRLV